MGFEMRSILLCDLTVGIKDIFFKRNGSALTEARNACARRALSKMKSLKARDFPCLITATTYRTQGKSLLSVGRF